MVKKGNIVATLVCLASVAMAQTVTLGTFGYSSHDIEAGGFKILANQFVGDSELSGTIGEAFGDSLPDGSELYIWNGVTYSVYLYTFGAWYDVDWQPASSVAIDRGDSLWAKNAAAVTSEVVFSGDIPESGSTTNALVAGYNMLANPYPTSITLDELNISPADGDELLLWDGGNYSVYLYTFGAWYDVNWQSASTVEIPVGNGFWYKTLNARNWVASKPY